MAGCASAALLHINLALAMYAGGALLACARLWWDPSLSVPLRAVLAPGELRAARGALPAAAAALAALAHAGAGALALPPRAQRIVLMVYAVLLSLWTAAAAAAGAAGARAAAAAARAFLRRDDVRALAEHAPPLLQLLRRHLPLPASLEELLKEAQSDVVAGACAAAAAAAALLVLACAAVALALRLALNADSGREDAGAEPLKTKLLA